MIFGSRSLPASLCPVDGGAVTTEEAGNGLLLCVRCSEFLYPHELVARKTRRTRRSYARSNGHNPDYGRRKDNR